jgi:hypothetical protein
MDYEITNGHISHTPGHDAQAVTDDTYTNQSLIWDTATVTYKIVAQFGRLRIVPLS